MYHQRNRSKTILHVLAALLLSAAMAAAAVPGLCNTGLSNGNYPYLCTGPIVAAGLTRCQLDNRRAVPDDLFQWRARESVCNRAGILHLEFGSDLYASLG